MCFAFTAVESLKMGVKKMSKIIVIFSLIEAIMASIMGN